MSKRKKSPQRSDKRGKHFTRTPLDEKNKFGTLPYNRLIAPLVGIHDEPTRCYRINLEWAPIVTGMMALLAETRMWKDVWDDGDRAITEIIKMLDGEPCEMADCTDVENCLDQSETIEQIVVFNYSQQLNATQDHFDTLTASYDGTAQSIGADIPTTAPSGNAFDDSALCWALNLTVDAYAIGKALQLGVASDFTKYWRDLINRMRQAQPQLPEWLWHLLGDQLYTCFPSAQTAIDALLTQSFRDELSCCLYQELRDVAMSEADWTSALATCEASLSAEPALIACLMGNDDTQEHYLSFLEIYQNVIVAQTDGMEPNCPCYWQETFDFANGDTRWVNSSQPITGCGTSTGVQVAAGWQGTYTNCGFGTPAYTVQIAPPGSTLGGANLIRRVTVEWMPSSQEFVSALCEFQARNGGAVTFNETQNANANVTGSMTFYVDGTHDNVALHFRTAVHSPEDAARQFHITRITLAGVGSNPFTP